MREIKFRGKRINDGKWVYGSLLQSEIAANGYAKCAICERFADSYNIREHDVVPESVGEFTGAIDKNEKEVYEGDIVNQGGHKPSEVFFEAGSFCTYLFGKGSSYLEMSQNSFDFEVIGNIHESNTVEH